MPRQARIDAPGGLNHIIIRGIERTLIFTDDRDRENFLERLSQQVTESQTPYYAWSLMSNHAHLLLRTGRVAIASIMRRLLTGYAVSFNKRHRRHRHLKTTTNPFCVRKTGICGNWWLTFISTRCELASWRIWQH